MAANEFDPAKLEQLGDLPAAQPSRAGFAASAALHAMAVAAVVLLFLTRTGTPTTPLEPVFVELVQEAPLGLRTQAPPAPVKARAPQQLGAKGPRAAPKPEGVRPHGDKPYEDPLETQLQQLGKLRSPDSPLTLDSDGSANLTASAEGAEGEAAYGVKDAIRAAILRRWNLNLTSLGKRNVVIRVRLSLKGSGEIASLSVDGMALHKKDLAWTDIALSAEHAAELSAPFPLPESLRRKGLTVTLDLDPRASLR